MASLAAAAQQDRCFSSQRATCSNSSVHRRPARMSLRKTEACPALRHPVLLAPWHGSQLHKARTNGARWHCAQWLENSAQIEVQAPLELCFGLWEDRERIPKWMPWITSVKVQKDDPRMSKWTLSTNQFNREWTFSWLAQNLTPVRGQKIHWRSVQGASAAPYVANRGQVRFYRRSDETCAVKLTISYEVPSILGPFAGALTPIVEGIIGTDLRRFAVYAAEHLQTA